MMTETLVKEEVKKEEVKTVKVLVWDLDDTVWKGTLIEGDALVVRPGVRETLQALDERGILHSIASKNDHDMAMEKLAELGLAEYFLYPQISWSAKSAGIEKIAQLINVGLDTVAFIDDQPFERDEVRHVLSQVRTYDTAELGDLLGREEFIPRFITDESSIRRKMYMADIMRNQVEEEYQGPQEDFLRGLGMIFTLAPAREEDLKRAEELTVRTNQLNTTGYTYSYDELAELRRSPDHVLLIAGLEDRYGTYGKIGLALIEKGRETWRLKLLLMSCRVMARGVGTIMMSHVMNLTKAAGAKLQAEFKSNNRNRQMLVTYKFAGFKEVDKQGELVVFEHDLENVQPFPEFVDVRLG